MIPVIAQQASRAYPDAMASAFLRLLALVAVLLMPAGMAGAPAMAQPAPAAAGVHCDEHQKPAEESAKAQMHCMGCSALPAFAVPASVETMVPEAPRRLTRMEAIAGIVPELPTPPPKLV